MKNIILLSFLSFILIFSSCSSRFINNRIINSTDSIEVVEGVGFLKFQVDKFTKDTVLKYFGTCFKEINHNNYSIEINYNDLGISFYYLYKTKPEKIFAVALSENFKGRTKRGFSISSMTLNDVLNIYGNPAWSYNEESDEISARYDDLGIEFAITMKIKINDSIPTSYYAQDVYVNRMLLCYFKSVYGNDKIKEITISTPKSINSERPYIGKSEIDSVFQVKVSKLSIPLLNNRLIANIPEEAIVNDDDSSYIVFEKSKQSFTISLIDYHCMASNDMNVDIEKIIKSWNTKDLSFKLKESFNKKDISVFIIEPSKIKLDDNWFLLNCAFIKNSDNTILFIKFEINTNAWYNKKNYLNLSNEIIKSIKSGDEKLNIKPELVKINTQEREIIINKPEGIVYKKNNGPDFMTYNFEKLVQFNELQSSMLIYIGNHPNYLYIQNNDSVVIVKKQGLLFGQKIEWNYCYKDKNYKFPYTIEGFCKFDNLDDVHVALTICSLEDAALFKKTLPNTDFNDKK